MKIHEYQGKEILRKFGVATPRGVPCFSVDEAVKAAEQLGGKVWVVKAQIHAGGRGKGGGVKLSKSLDEVRAHATAILGMQLKTHQTGPEGQQVRRLLIEDGADIKKEYYVAALTDRATQKVAIMASSEGGMDIEEVAHSTPEKIIKVFVDPLVGLTDAQAQELADGIGVKVGSVSSWEADSAKPRDTFTVVSAIAEATDVSVVWLAGLDTQDSRRYYEVAA
jgi:succinyl-CoA synthetase beta subunit